MKSTNNKNCYFDDKNTNEFKFQKSYLENKNFPSFHLKRQ